MAFQKVTGTDLSISAAVPATYDAVGFQALSFTDTDPCQIIDISGWSDAWEVEEDDTLCPDGGQALKTKRVLGTFEATLKYDKTNAIHGLLKTAFDSAADVISVQLTHPDGVDKQYFTAQVTEYNPVLGGQSDFYTTPVVFQPQGVRIEDFA